MDTCQSTSPAFTNPHIAAFIDNPHDPVNKLNLEETQQLFGQVLVRMEQQYPQLAACEEFKAIVKLKPVIQEYLEVDQSLDTVEEIQYFAQLLITIFKTSHQEAAASALNALATTILNYRTALI